MQALVFKRRRARRYRPPSLAMAIEQQPEFSSPVLAIIQHPMSHAFCSSFALHRCPGLARGAPWLSNPETMPRAPFPLPRCTTGGGMHEARCPWHKTKSRENCVYIQSQCVPRRPAWWRTCAPSPCQCPTTARIVATLCRNPAGNLQSPNAAFLRADNPARRGHAADTNQTAETHLTLLQTQSVPKLPEHRGHAVDENQTAETHLTVVHTKCPETHSYLQTAETHLTVLQTKNLETTIYRSIGGTPPTKMETKSYRMPRNYAGSVQGKWSFNADRRNQSAMSWTGAPAPDFKWASNSSLPRSVEASMTWTPGGTTSPQV